MRASAVRCTSESCRLRYSISSAMVVILRSCCAAKASRSGSRAMVPSSRRISQMTPAGANPARRARSTAPSVCPARTRTPPRRARSGKTWPGVTMSADVAFARTAVRMVVARSTAEMPRPMPWRASTETVNAVPSGARFSLTIIGRPSWSQRFSVSDRQMSPRPYVAMKFTCSAVTRSAATQRSPSFSRSSSSIKMIMRPARSSASASSIPTTWGLCPRGDIGQRDDRWAREQRLGALAEGSPGDRPEDDGAAQTRENARSLTQEEEHPDRVRDRLEHADEGGLGGTYVRDPVEEEEVRAGDLHGTEEEEDGRRPRVHDAVAPHEGEEHEHRQDVAPADRRFGPGAALAAEKQHEPREEHAGRERDEVARTSGRVELADEEERHAPERDRDRDRVAGAERLAEDDRRDREHPHDAAVLEEDRVRRRRPLGRHDERRERRRVARERADEARRRSDARAKEREEHDGRDGGAPAGDRERRRGDRLDPDPARRPEERRTRDGEDAAALVAHSTVTLFARLRGWSTSVPR